MTNSKVGNVEEVDHSTMIDGETTVPGAVAFEANRKTIGKGLV